MQSANVLLALAGKRDHTVPKYGVTPAEVAVLRFLHGEDAVYEVDVQGDVSPPRTGRQEIERLRGLYSRQEGEKLLSPAVSALFPGVAAHVPTKFAELELPEELFIVQSRKVEDPHPLDHDGDGRKGGSKPRSDRPEGIAGMTLNDLRAYADKVGCDITGLTRKQDIVDAIELHEKATGAGGEQEDHPGDGQSENTSVFE